MFSKENQKEKVENIEVTIDSIIYRKSTCLIQKGKMKDGTAVALKRQFLVTEDEQTILQVFKEKKFEHIIQIFAFENGRDGFLILMELGSKLELNRLTDKRMICLQMAKCVSQLHGLGYFHRDLKPENFVLGQDNNIKLIDFETTKQIHERLLTMQKGTFLYTAPEVFKNEDYDSSVDIWSLGMVFYQVFLEQTFFDLNSKEDDIIEISQKQINFKIDQEKKLEQWQKQLLKQMIVQRLRQGQIDKSIKRISIDEVIVELTKVYEFKKDLYEILAQLKEIDVQTFGMIIELLRKQKISDILEFLSKNNTQVINEQLIDKSEKLNTKTTNLQLIKNVLKNIQTLEFNKQDYSTDGYLETKKDLILKIQQDEKIVQFLKLLVQLTAIDNQFIQSGSNSLHLLVTMKVDLKDSSFENIRIRNTSLIGGNFVRCNLSRSEFYNVNISGLNLSGAKLVNCKWKKLKIIELNKFVGHGGAVQSVCISPDGTILASGSKDKSIRLWYVKTGQQLAILNGHTGAVYSVCFSRDGTRLASGSEDKSIRLWDVKTRQQNGQLNGHTSDVHTVCFSPDGDIIASDSRDGSICAWYVKEERLMTQLFGVNGIKHSICYSPDGTKLAFGTGEFWKQNHFIFIMDLKKKQQKRIVTSTFWINSLCFSPDGNTIASGGGNIFLDPGSCFLILWDVNTTQQKLRFNGHTNCINSICFSPDGTTLASCSGNCFLANGDCSIRFWDVNSGQQKGRLDGLTSIVWSVCFSPDGTKLASGCDDGSISLIDVKIGQQQANQEGHTNCVNSVCISPDGTTLASCSGISLLDGGDFSIRLWNVQTGKQIAKLYGHTHCVNQICLSPDGKLASASEDKSIRLWDIKTGQQKDQYNCHTEGVKQICFSTYGNTLASSHYNSINLWDVTIGQFQLKFILDCCGTNYSICFSPDGSSLASASSLAYGHQHQTIILWDIETRQQNAKLEGHTNNVNALCYSPDGTILASGCINKSVRLWDVKTAQQIAIFDGHSDRVTSVCFSPDGNTLASGSEDKSIRLWDVKIRKVKAILNGHTRAVNSVCFSPDGNTLASGSGDNSIRLWDIQTEKQTSMQDQNNFVVFTQSDDSQFKKNLPQEFVKTNITSLLISQTPIFLLQNAIINQGEFENYQCEDLRALFKIKGSYFLESQIELSQEKNEKKLELQQGKNEQNQVELSKKRSKENQVKLQQKRNENCLIY